MGRFRYLTDPRTLPAVKESSMSRGNITDPADIKTFMLAGKARFTLEGQKARFTYRVKQSKGDGGPWWVQVLDGPDNEADYRYIGFITDEAVLLAGKKGCPDAPSFQALAWYLRHLGDERVGFYHEGRCGRCGRTLTVPESIATGMGPVCATL